MSSTPYAIDAAGLTKWFGRTRALHDVTLQASWGCVVGLFGQNGAGKSTLLRALATLASLDSGSARVAGYDVRREAMGARRTLGYVGHANYLYSNLTARENLRFYAQLHRLSDADDRIEALLDDAGLARRADVRVHTLSNGMQKRLSIAHAILHRPRILLLDEPETGLDERGLALLEEVVVRLAEAGGTTVVATHAVERGLQMANRVVLLDEGALAIDEDVGSVRVSDIHAVLAGRERAV